jgi:mannose-binding lectin 1
MFGMRCDANLIRFEYKYSFKPPYLAQKDGSVPFFEYSGNAIASEEMVRITPSLRSQKGEFFAPSLYGSLPGFPTRTL